MALPSQVERSNENSRPVMARGGRGAPSKGVMGAIGLVVLAVAAFALYKMLPADATSPKSANAAEKDTKASKSPPPAPVSIAPTTPPAPPVDNPMVLTQGRGGGITDPGTQPGMIPGAFDPTKPKPVDVTGGNPTGPVTPPNPNAPRTTPPSGPGGTVPTLTPSNSGADVKAVIDTGDKAMMSGNLVAARVAYSRALMNPQTAPSDQEVLRQKLMSINDDLVFSSRIIPGDPLVETYSVASGDALERIRKKRDLATDWRLIARVNHLANANSLKVGQKLKLVKGPFNVVVHKADHRLDLFAGSAEDPDSQLFIRSFTVGLGADGGTPVGTFIIKNKMTNPDWRNPKTGERFDKDDPKNPIGEYWMGWEGLGDSRLHTGFGLHGTIDPTSIGQSKSMGCVRMGNDDIALMYELLVERISQVKVVEK